MEKFQYGQKVQYQITEILEDFKTEKCHIQYVQTLLHGKMLLMDGEVQYSTMDEHRYHILLTWAAMSIGCRKILILGGGDGLAAKWLYRSGITESITIVDWDHEMVDMSKNLPENDGALNNPKTTIVYQDALEYVKTTPETYDAVLIDLPDPDGEQIEILYLDIVAHLSRVCRPNAVVTAHVGPASLCKEHPAWTFIRDCKSEMEMELGDRIVFDKIYVPSFSHEWGFLNCYLGNATIVPRVEIKDIAL
jgi:spermidine synthase